MSKSFTGSGLVLGALAGLLVFPGAVHADPPVPQVVKDIVSGSGGSSPMYLTHVGAVIFFSADDGVNGRELWKSDGTAAGTVLVKDIHTSGSSNPQSLCNFNGTLYFSATDGTNGRELWKSDGTAGGTVLVKNIHTSGDSDPQYITAVDSTLYFSADDGTDGRELWKSTGAVGNATLVKNINTAGDSNPQYLANVNGTLYFGADDGSNGRELWKSNGLAANTTLFQDIRSGSVGSDPRYLTWVHEGSFDHLFFSADNGPDGRELWISQDGGAATIVNINGSGSSNPESLTNVQNLVESDGRLYFSADDGAGRILYRYDYSTPAVVAVQDGGLMDVPNPLNLANVNGTLFFTVAGDLWKSNGSGTGSLSFGFADFGQAVGTHSSLFFTQDDPTAGVELTVLAGRIEVSTNEMPVAGSQFSITVNAYDAAEVFIVGYVVQVLADNPPTQTLEALTGEDAATATVTLNGAGLQTVTGKGAGDPLAGTLQVTVAPGPIHHFTVMGFANPTVAGVEHNFTVTAYDEFDNVKTDYTGMVNFSSSDFTATLPDTYTFQTMDEGVKQFAATLNGTGTHSIGVTDFTGSGEQTGITVNDGLTLVSAESAKVHGAVTRKLLLNLSALSELEATVEPRLGGSTQIIFTCSHNAKGTGTLGAPEAANFEVYDVADLDTPLTGVYQSSGINNTVVTLNLQNVPTNKRLLVKLVGISRVSDSAPLIAGRVYVGNLYCDVDGNGTVQAASANPADFNTVKAQVFKALTEFNFVCDVNRDGKIDNLDLNLVRSRNGQTFP